MKIREIIWIAEFVEKIERKHNLSIEEVEEAFSNLPQIEFIEKGDVRGENLYRLLGETDNGRQLAVFFIYKKGGKALVVSARKMSKREKKKYGEFKA
jgi:uncharacterized DUF497 family protein